MNTTQEKTKTIDEKLGELLLNGWTMQAEVCVTETCHCPLMKAKDGNSYCVGCESWVFEKERKKTNYRDLDIYKGTDLQVVKGEVSKLPQSKSENDYLNYNITTVLELKLAYLANLLLKETNVNKIKELLELINLNISVVENIKKCTKSGNIKIKI